MYAPDPGTTTSPHSIYFQVMGDHGFIGLVDVPDADVLHLAHRLAIIKLCNDDADQKWASQPGQDGRR